MHMERNRVHSYRTSFFFLLIELVAMLYAGMPCLVAYVILIYGIADNVLALFLGTGDHTYDRRLRLGGPLVKQNIATMVLER